MLHPSHRRTRHARRAAATIVALTALLTLGASCGDDGDDGPTADDTTTTTAKSTTSSSTTVPPEELPEGHFIELVLPDGLTAEEKEVAEAYRDASEALARALRDPTLDHDPLANTHTGPALKAAERRLRSFAEDGDAVRSAGPMSLQVLEANMADGEGGLLVCLTDSSEAYDTATGEVVGTNRTPPHQVVVALQESEGTWKLAESTAPRTDDGENRPCPGAG